MPTPIRDKRDSLPHHAKKKYMPRSGPWTIAIIHHSLTSGGSAEAFARYHVTENNWPGIGYHYVINIDGTIDWCQSHETKSYHVGKHNGYCLGICMVGDFRKSQPDPRQIQSAYRILKEILNVTDPTKIMGHSELPGYDWKKCPVIDMNVFRAEYKALLP